MSHPFQNELKKEFQLERMILFSDAIFAIAITLLAIEIKVPEIAHDVVTDHLLNEKLGELVPKFIGFLVSFFVIAIYWIAHHRIFGYLVNYNLKLLWLNLFFLLGVVLMPFSSAFYSEYLVRHLKAPMIIYLSNIVFLGCMNFWLWNYISNPKNELSVNVDRHLVRYIRFRALVPVFVFLSTGIVYLYIKPAAAIWMPMLIAPIMMLVRRKYFTSQKLKHTK